MKLKTNVVTVQYKDRHGEGYGGREYCYYAKTPLEVGQIVKCPTVSGETQARVSRVGISEATLPETLWGNLKAITSAHILLKADGEPCMYEG